jgi:hypothetical protein
MLPNRHLQLLTAYVDGELSPRQRRHATRLLRQSDEARVLLRQLQDDAARVRQLPRLASPIDLSTPVLAALGPGKRRPTVRLASPASPPVPTWVGWATAAAVLLTVGPGTFLYYSQPGSGGSSATRRTKPDEQKPPVRDDHLAKNLPASYEDKQDVPPPPPEEDQPGKGDREPERTPEKAIAIDKPLPEKPDDPVLADGGKEPFSKFERIELALPVVFKLHDLDQPNQARKLRDHLADAPSYRVEVLARNPTRAFDRVKGVLEARKIALVIDAGAQAMFKPQIKSDYGLFIENITSADLAELLADLGAADKAPNRKPPEKLLEGSLVVKELSVVDQKELIGLLGVDPIRKRPAPTKSTGLDVRKSISDSTAKQVEEILEGKRAPRPGTTQPELSVLVLPLGTSRRSAEVKRFLDQRKPARAGTLQVFLVLRNVG